MSRHYIGLTNGDMLELITIKLPDEMDDTIQNACNNANDKLDGRAVGEIISKEDAERMIDAGVGVCDLGDFDKILNGKPGGETEMTRVVKMLAMLEVLAGKDTEED